MKVPVTISFIGSSRFRRLAKEAGWLFIGQIASVAGTLVMVRVLTEYLDPAQYGELALSLTLAALVNQVVMGGIINGIGRFYSIAAEKQNFGSYLNASLHLLGYATMAVLVIGSTLIACMLWLKYSHLIELVVTVIVFSLLGGYNSTLSSIQNAARQRAVVAFHGGLNAWLNIPLAVGMMLWLGKTSTSVVIAYICASLLVTASQFFFMRRTITAQQLQSSDYKPWMLQMWAYSRPFCIWGLFTWMQQISDRWALHFFATTTEVGQYALLFQLSYTPIAMVTAMAISFLGPILYQRSGDARDQARNANVHRLSWRMTYLSLMVTLLGFAITFMMHEWFFYILVAPVYRDISYLLPWGVLAGGIFAAGQVLALKLMSEIKSATMSSAKIITALMGILFNVIGAERAGIHGVVGALLAFSVIYFIWMAMLARRKLTS